MPKAFVIAGLLLFILNFALDKVFAATEGPAAGPFVEENSLTPSVDEKSQWENTVKISHSVAKINLKSMRKQKSQGSRGIAASQNDESDVELSTPPPLVEPSIIRQVD